MTLAPSVWAFSGDVAFSLGHMFFHENTGIVLEGCWCLFSLPPFGRVWVPKHLQRRGTETRKQMFSLQESDVFDV